MQRFLVFLNIILALAGISSFAAEGLEGEPNAAMADYHYMINQGLAWKDKFLTDHRGGVTALHDAKTDLIFWVWHQSRITTAAFARSGRVFLTGSRDNTIYMWSTENAEPIREFDGDHGHKNGVETLIISPDERWFVTAGRNDPIHLWDLDSVVCKATFDDNYGSYLRVSPDGRRIFSIAAGGDVGLVWDPETRDVERRIALENYETRAEFSPNSQLLALATSDGKIRIVDLDADVASIEFDLDAQPSKLMFAGDKTLLAQYPNAVVVMDLANGHRQFLQGHTRDIRTLTISSDGRWLLTAAEDNTIKVWSLPSGDLFHSFLINPFAKAAKIPYALALSEDNEQLFAFLPDGLLRLWRLDLAAKVSGDLGNRWRSPLGPHGGGYESYARSGHRIALQKFNPVTIQIWNNETGMLERVVEKPDDVFWGKDLQFSDDGRKLFVKQSTACFPAWSTIDVASGEVEPGSKCCP